MVKNTRTPSESAVKTDTLSSVTASSYDGDNEYSSEKDYNSGEESAAALETFGRKVIIDGGMRGGGGTGMDDIPDSLNLAGRMNGGKKRRKTRKTKKTKKTKKTRKTK